VFYLNNINWQKNLLKIIKSLFETQYFKQSTRKFLARGKCAERGRCFYRHAAQRRSRVAQHTMLAMLHRIVNEDGWAQIQSSRQEGDGNNERPRSCAARAVAAPPTNNASAQCSSICCAAARLPQRDFPCWYHGGAPWNNATIGYRQHRCDSLKINNITRRLRFLFMTFSTHQLECMTFGWGKCLEYV